MLTDSMIGRGSGGRPLTEAQLQQFRAKVWQEHRIDLVKHRRDFPESLQLRPVEGASFRVMTDGSRKIIVRENATAYEVMHEYFHALHYEQVLTTRGAGAYSQISKREREQFVYDAMRTHFWHRLTDEQKRNAAYNVIQAAGFAW